MARNSPHCVRHYGAPGPVPPLATGVHKSLIRLRNLNTADQRRIVAKTTTLDQKVGGSNPFGRTDKPPQSLRLRGFFYGAESPTVWHTLATLHELSPARTLTEDKRPSASLLTASCCCFTGLGQPTSGTNSYTPTRLPLHNRRMLRHSVWRPAAVRTR